MASGPWTFTNTARTKILSGQFNFASDTFKCALFLSTSNIGAASTTYAGVTNEVAAANGYTTGGVTVAFTLSGTTSVAGSFTSNPSFTAAGGSIVGRTAAVYEVGGDIVCYSLLDTTAGGTDVTTTAGNTLTVDSDGTPNPAFILA